MYTLVLNPKKTIYNVPNETIYNAETTMHKQNISFLNK